MEDTTPPAPDSPGPPSDLARRSLRSTAYNIASSAGQTAVLFLRQVLLARLLDPEIFGVYTYAAAFVVLTRALPRFGLGSALLHRARESEGETALRVHFTLTTVFGIAWLVLLGSAGTVILDGQALLVLWAIALTEFLDQLTDTARTLLVRRVVFRRIAVMNLATALISTIVAVVMAWRGYGVWSLVATDVVAAVVLLAGFYGYRPVWRPRFGWSLEIVRYFLRFGVRTLLAETLLKALDRLDDVWTGFVLGERSLGFYSRAYTFATYPRRVLASPLNAVSAGTYAELKDQPKRLSQAFFRVNAFLVRIGFLAAGLLALVAPEFIRIVIGVKWLPMLTAFRLMLIFTMLDPIKMTISSLFVAVGRPEKTVRARSVQLMVLAIGLVTLGPRLGIAGVALAVDMMLCVGIALLLWQARAHVQFSILRLFAVPSLALGAGMLLARASILLPGVLGSPWRTGGVKTAVFLPVYGLVLLLLERKQVFRMLQLARKLALGSEP